MSEPARTAPTAAPLIRLRGVTKVYGEAPSCWALPCLRSWRAGGAST